MSLYDCNYNSTFICGQALTPKDLITPLRSVLECLDTCREQNLLPPDNAVNEDDIYTVPARTVGGSKARRL